MIKTTFSNKTANTLAAICVVLGTLLASTAPIAPALARDVPSTKPEREGLSSERLEQIKSLAERYVADKRVPGMITMVARNGKIVHFEATGQRGLKDTRPLQKDDLFRIYSMSKPITAVALMMLYEEGKFRLSDPVHLYIPELKELSVYNPDGDPVPAKTPVTMQQLLTHTAGFSYGFNPADPVDQKYQAAKIFEAKDLTEFAERVAALPLQFQPGSKWHYSVASDLVGLAVERISGVPFADYLEQEIFTPLGMDDTFFNVPEDKRERFLANQGWDAANGEYVDVTARTDARGNYTNGTLASGGGGLVSSTMDYMRFCEMLRNGGSYEGVRLLSPKTIEYMTLNHLPAAIDASGSGETPTLGALGSSGVGFGLGFSVVTPCGSRHHQFKGRIRLGWCRGYRVLDRPGGRDREHRDDSAHGISLATASGSEVDHLSGHHRARRVRNLRV